MVLDQSVLLQMQLRNVIIVYEVKATTKEVPQGGIISSCISIIALSGLEGRLAQKFKRNRGKVHVVLYADDFIITGESKAILEKEVIPIVESFLAERGLFLSKEKSHITHIEQGFDFLGFNIRKYGHRLKFLTKSSKPSVKSFLADIKHTVRKNFGANAENLIWQLNPEIVGWCNYYRHSAASKTFSYIAITIFHYINFSFRIIIVHNFFSTSMSS